MEEGRRFGLRQVAEDFLEIAKTYEQILLALHSRILKLEESLADASSKLEETSQNIRQLEASASRERHQLGMKFRRMYWFSVSSFGLAAACLAFLLFVK